MSTNEPEVVDIPRDAFVRCPKVKFKLVQVASQQHCIGCTFNKGLQLRMSRSQAAKRKLAFTEQYALTCAHPMPREMYAVTIEV